MHVFRIDSEHWRRSEDLIASRDSLTSATRAGRRLFLLCACARDQVPFSERETRRTIRSRRFNNGLYYAPVNYRRRTCINRLSIIAIVWRARARARTHWRIIDALRTGVNDASESLMIFGGFRSHAFPRLLLEDDLFPRHPLLATNYIQESTQLHNRAGFLARCYASFTSSRAKAETFSQGI